MIKKLKQRIFFIIMLSLSLLVVGSIMILAFSNYRNTMRATNIMLDRVEDAGIHREPNLKPPKENINLIDIDELYLEVENQVKRIFGVAILSAILALIAIYIIAKKLANLLVRPVEETMKKQKQFISDASHELKTPLAVIEANTDVLENEVGKENKWISYIQTEIESMNKLINELLLLAKIENVDDFKEYKEFDLSKEVEIIISMFESLAYEKQVKIISKLQENIMANGIKEDVEHILSTLLDNAIKHSEPEKDVTVELSKEKNDIVLQVKNMGEPIPEEEKDKIFERFYRVDKSRNRNEKRYGLGLAIAQSTVKKYNGKINVICKDGITNFRVSIPTSK